MICMYGPCRDTYEDLFAIRVGYGHCSEYVTPDGWNSCPVCGWSEQRDGDGESVYTWVLRAKTPKELE